MFGNRKRMLKNKSEQQGNLLTEKGVQNQDRCSKSEQGVPYTVTYTEPNTRNNRKIDMVCSKSVFGILKQERLFGNSTMMFGNRKRMLKNKSEQQGNLLTEKGVQNQDRCLKSEQGVPLHIYRTNTK